MSYATPAHFREERGATKTATLFQDDPGDVVLQRNLDVGTARINSAAARAGYPVPLTASTLAALAAAVNDDPAEQTDLVDTASAELIHHNVMLATGAQVQGADETKQQQAARKRCDEWLATLAAGEWFLPPPAANGGFVYISDPRDCPTSQSRERHLRNWVPA